MRYWLVLLVIFGFSLGGCQRSMTSVVPSTGASPPAKEEAPTIFVEDELQDSSTKVVINIPARELKLYHNKKVLFQFPVAVGTNAYKTPVGHRAVDQIVWNPWWIPPSSPWAKGAAKAPPGPNNPLGVVKLRLGKAILLHGTNKEYTVGRPASHGCMRMYKENVKTLAWWIQTHFTSKDDPKLLEDYAKNSKSSYYVAIDNPVPVEIKYDLFSIENGLFKAYPDIYWKVGNKKQNAYSWLQQRGFSMAQIDGFALEKLLLRAEKQTASISLRDLMPAKLSIADQPIADPMDVAWKENLLEKQGKSWTLSMNSPIIETFSGEFSFLF